MPHPRYERAFASDTDVVTIGKLDLPSGRVVVCDPYLCAEAHSFSRLAPPGEYDVQVRRLNSSEWGERIAFARLLIRPGDAVASFELATRGAGDSGRFLVNSGVASYMDDVTRVVFAEVLVNYYGRNPGGNYYTDVLEAEFKKSAVDQTNPLDPGRWNLHRLPGTELSVAMFASGLGDGAYQSWWGFAASGHLVSLVTDFLLL
jgi:Protein of unknown function (DUF4241)